VYGGWLMKRESGEMAECLVMHENLAISELRSYRRRFRDCLVNTVIVEYGTEVHPSIILEVVGIKSDVCQVFIATSHLICKRPNNSDTWEA